jgi:hypothetical protein
MKVDVKLKVYIEPDLLENQNKIIEEYWENTDGVFTNKHAELLKKYSLTKKQLTSLVESNSYMIVEFGKCFDCGVNLEDKFLNRSAVSDKLKGLRSSFSPYSRCSIHLKEYFNAKSEKNSSKPRNSKRFDSNPNILLELDESDNIIISNIRENIKIGMLDKLTEEELSILIGIIKCENKQSVYKYVFNGIFNDPEIWRIVNNIQDKKLLYVKRNGTSVVGFYFPEEIYQVLKVKKPAFLTIFLNSNPFHSSDKHPMVMGDFELNKDFVFKKGVKYNYVGWKHSGENIILKFSEDDEYLDAKRMSPSDNDIKPIGEHINIVMNKLSDDTEFGPDPF